MVQGCRDRSNPVIKFKTPEELQKCINFQLSSEGVDHSELLKLSSSVIDNSARTGRQHLVKMAKLQCNTSPCASHLLEAYLLRKEKSDERDSVVNQTGHAQSFVKP